MIDGFIRFYENLFPSITPYAAEGVKAAIGRFRRDNGSIAYTTKLPFKAFRQGDFFSEIPFYYMDPKGDYGFKKCNAMLLTNTCDTERNDYLTFAAAIPVSDFEENKIRGLEDNTNFQFLFVPGASTDDFVIDFGLLSVVPRTMFNEAFSANKITRKASLTTVGYFLFITKLTAFFMRPEDSEAYKSRERY